MIKVSNASRSPASESARLTSWTSATFFCSRCKACWSETSGSSALAGARPAPSDMPPSYRKLFHAAATQVVFIETLEVPDLVQQRVANLLRQLGPGLHGPREV